MSRWPDGSPCRDAIAPAVKIILYKRSFPVPGAPESLSLTPYPGGAVCTFPVGGRVYEARYSEVPVLAPDGAKVDRLRNRVVWHAGTRLTRSTAREVFDLARAAGSGFSLTG